MTMRSLAIFAVLAVTPGIVPDARAGPISEEEAATLRAQLATLKTRIEELERRLAEGARSADAADSAGSAASMASAASDSPSPSSSPAPLPAEWKGAPRFVEQDRSFKVRGRIQVDFNHVAAPSGLNDRAMGFSSEIRRIRLGGEGELGSGFGYKLEVELADNSVDLADAYGTYKTGPWLFTLGYQNPFQSLEELTGDSIGSFMERAAFTDAFNFERRLGLSAQYGRGPLIAQIGVFTDDVGALADSSDGPSGGDENNSFSVDGRLVYAPRLGAAQLHFGASGHWRRLRRLAEAPMRYRQRPFVHSVNTRLIGTPFLNASEERSYGLELAGIRGPWHFASEAHWLRASTPGRPSPDLWGGYAEIGYFLTRGDSRPYEDGIFGGIDPKSPLGKGGIGAIQLNLRYDRLDLNSADIRGGTQDAYLAALIWTPIRYLRFNLNYGYIDYSGATPLADGRGSYGLHVIGSRFELDF